MKVDETKIEQLNADEAKVAEMLAGLKRVEAPANFEFGLKAKLARTERPARGRWFVPGFVRFSAPVAAFAIVGSFFYLNSTESGENPAIQTAGVVPRLEQFSPPAAALPMQPPASAIRPENPVVPRPVIAESRNRSTRRATADPVAYSSVRTVRPASGLGSTVRTLNQPKIFLPSGIDPSSLPGNSTTSPQNKSAITVNGVLPTLGIDAEYGTDGWKVRTVKSNSTAERAGVKAGDVLEALDDNQLGKDPAFRGIVNPRVIKVKRAGGVVELKIPNR